MTSTQRQTDLSAGDLHRGGAPRIWRALPRNAHVS
jgi:hypothetical protein